MSKKVKFLRFSQKEGAFEPPFKKLFVDFDKLFDKARQGSTKQLILALLHELNASVHELRLSPHEFSRTY